MAPRAFRELFRMTKRVFELFLAECEPWLPAGLSTNGKSISPRLQLLIFLYYVTGAIPFRHLAVAAGVKKSTCQKIIRKVVDALIENGFVSKWITRITEVLTTILELQTTTMVSPRTTDTQWRLKSKISEKLGQCGRQNMLPPYLKIWDWDWIFGRAVKAIFSLGVRSPCVKVSLY